MEKLGEMTQTGYASSVRGPRIKLKEIAQPGDSLSVRCPPNIWDRLWDEYEKTQESSASNRTPNSASKRRRLEKKMPLMATDEPKKNQILTEPRVTVTEDSGSDASTARSHPPLFPDNFPYALLGRVMDEVSKMAFNMEGMEIVTRELLDNELLKLATRAVPDQDDPTSKVMRSNYIGIARALGPQVIKNHNMARKLTGQILLLSDDKD